MATRQVLFWNIALAVCLAVNRDSLWEEHPVDPSAGGGYIVNVCKKADPCSRVTKEARRSSIRRLVTNRIGAFHASMRFAFLAILFVLGGRCAFHQC